MRVFIIFIIPLLFVACSSEPIGNRKTYWSVRLASQIDGLYRIESKTQGDLYCYDTNKYGEKVYSDSCDNQFGVKIFSNPQDLVSESIRLVEESCGGTGTAKLVGQDSGNEYAGTTPVSCSSNMIGNSLNTNCYGGHAQFNSVLLAYYRCELKNHTTGVNKNNLPESDKKFLDNMLKSGKINQNQYDNILHGTPLTTDAENAQTHPAKEESRDLFLDY
jgi:hypothetical protein